MGVREVRNHIFVDPIEQVEDEALSRTITSTLAVTRGLGNTVIHVAVTGGHVVLGVGCYQRSAMRIACKVRQTQSNHQSFLFG
jgi:osmotically-inducible protein OsmY